MPSLLIVIHAVLIIGLVGIVPAGLETVSGVVTDAEGRPLPGVRVLSLPFDEATTDASGRFELTNPAPLVRFSMAGYQPVTRLTASLGTPTRLERSTNGPWTPATCSAGETVHGASQGSMRFRIPKGARLQRGADIDYELFVVKRGRHLLTHGGGVHWSYGLPLMSDWKALQSVVERDVSGPLDTADYRGLLNDGTHFRFVGRLGETIVYRGVDPATAAYFDTIIDSLCWRP
jgi:hypothetical protein